MLVLNETAPQWERQRPRSSPVDLSNSRQPHHILRMRNGELNSFRIPHSTFRITRPYLPDICPTAFLAHWKSRSDLCFGSLIRTYVVQRHDICPDLRGVFLGMRNSGCGINEFNSPFRIPHSAFVQGRNNPARGNAPSLG